MVDFNNETTVTQSPTELVKIMLLERRKYVIDAIEHYYKNTSNGIKPAIGVIKSRLLALFYELKPSLTSADVDTVKLAKELDVKDIKELLNAFDTLNQYFYDLQLTKIDYKKLIDTTNVEIENLEKGL